MGLMGTLTKAGIATKVINEVRKPQNQTRIKRFLANMNAKRRTRR